MGRDLFAERAWAMDRAIVLVHGGAGSWRREGDLLGKSLEAVREAAERGYSELRRGGAVEAVVEAVAYMEDTGLFNAGRGSVLDVKGGRSLDAGVMASDGRIGAVAAATYTRNPVRLAYRVMVDTDHVLIGGAGADELARRLGLPPLDPPPPRILERYHRLLQEYRAGRRRIYAGNLALLERISWYDTVGAAAYDPYTRILAAAVSTGGVWLKLPGRIGDSAVPGAGFYASEDYALSATGIGEYIIKTMPGLLLRGIRGRGLGERARRLLSLITENVGPGNTGLIIVGRGGSYAVGFNTRHIMVAARYRGFARSCLMENRGTYTVYYNRLPCA